MTFLKLILPIFLGLIIIDFTRGQNATDSKICNNNGRVVNSTEEPKCQCSPGYSGNKCEYKDCDSNTNAQCQHDGKCRIRVANNQIECDCPAFYSGALCEKTSCIGYCYNGAACEYTEADKSLKCNCLGRFFSDRCQFDKCYEAKKCDSNCYLDFNSSTKQCACLCGKECDRTFCNQQGTCKKNDANNLECNCNSGFSSATCLIDDCKGYCFNGGTCVRKDSAISCECPKGLWGKRCESTASTVKTVVKKANGFSVTFYIIAMSFLICFVIVAYLIYQKGGCGIVKDSINNVVFKFRYVRTPQASESNIPYLRTTAAHGDDTDILTTSAVYADQN